MNVSLRLAAVHVRSCVCIYFFYSHTSLLPSSLHPPTFFPSNRSNCSVSMRHFSAAAASISLCLPHYEPIET